MTEPQSKPESNNDDQNSFRSLMKQAAPWWDVAFMLPAGVLVGYGLGMLLNHFLHARWTLVAGVVFGVVVGFIGMIRRVLALSR